MAAPTSLTRSCLLLNGEQNPATLPFELPKTLDDVDETWMTKLLRHRGILSGDVAVSKVEKRGVGMTAGYFSAIAKVECTFSEPVDGAPTRFVVKAWPPFEIAPAGFIAALFACDIKGYCSFESSEWYPRPDCYLASFDAEKRLFGLVMADADVTGVHKVHEIGLTRDEVLKMVPFLAEHAARFENCHEEGTAMFPKAAHVPMFTSPAFLAPMSNPADGGKPFSDGAPLLDKFTLAEEFGAWGDKSQDGMATLMAKKFEALWARVSPANGGSVTLAHGDLRGDNIFFTDVRKEGWMCIDFQLNFKGPVPSDVAYLLTSGSVLPDVYEEHLDEILKAFYDEFQKHTKAYATASGYTYDMFVDEFRVMGTVMLAYYVAYGAPFFLSGAVDGKTDPTKPDTVTGPISAAPELGSGAVKTADLSKEDIRKRMWWSKALTNIGVVNAKLGLRELLESLEDNKY